MADNEVLEVAERTVVALGVAGVSGMGPDAAALMISLTPIAEFTLDKVITWVIGGRRKKYAAETLTDAAEEAGATTVDSFIAFIKNAVSDEPSQELLTRALNIAQDCSLRAKRRAISKSIAAGVTDKGTKVDEEFLFLRAIDDLDAPHFRTLKLMSSAPPHPEGLHKPGSVVSVGWTPTMILAEDSGLSDTLGTLLSGLQRHNLIRGPQAAGITLADRNGEFPLQVTDYGLRFLERLEEPDLSQED
jgi:hypothetical protein